MELLPKLSQNLLEILNDEEFYDITIEVGNDPYVRIFRAHMVILYYRSPYLRRIITLTTNKRKNDGILSHIKLPNISPEIFEIILRYIYSGEIFISLNECDTSIIIKTLVSAGELYLQELIKYLQSFLIKNKSEWMEQNFDIVYNASFENDSFLDLQNYCTDLISKQPDKIFNSLNFSLIPEKLLISVIQNNDLQTTEIQVWDHVLKWGLAQNPDLPSDPTNYSKDDFNTLKNTLKQCIPFIRFHNLTSKEFLDKVFPYRKILPKELYIDLLKEFLGNDNKKSGKSKPRMNKEISLITIDSKIISFQQAELILKWVDRSKIGNKLTSPCEFKLLFRGSRDGLTREKFHQYCDDHSRTVTIVKVKDNNEILGGYNPVEWRSYGGDSITKDSFIFSFNNNNNDNNSNETENYILSRITNENHAILNGSFNGPSFGNTDLIILGFLGNYCRQKSYEKPIRKFVHFDIEECEQVNKKKKQAIAMAEENEFYSKLCVAEIFRGAVDEKSEEEIDLLEECYFC
ncbi:hypothetical protein RhiirA1_461373 [Rhizophagus irregularis]|uniref:Kelch-like protein 17 n=1 Tax=Rhizophagus irregularis TaxID=588596 RepID=A0A2N0RPH7_9GLOM|nr:hypothetical protein RhiirA1_461373 [Rhizophagus irregularis]